MVVGDLPRSIFLPLFHHWYQVVLFFIHAPRNSFNSLPMSYSSFFSSGLSAVQHLTPPPSPTQSVRPDSPILPSTPIREAATDITNQDPTSIAVNPFRPFDTERPRPRKRRSSLTVNTSPLVQLKGSYRGAAAATQRQNRSRSGSVNTFSQPCSVGPPIEEAKIVGRLRSGSVNNPLRCAMLGLFRGLDTAC